MSKNAAYQTSPLSALLPRFLDPVLVPFTVKTLPTLSLRTTCCAVI